MPFLSSVPPQAKASLASLYDTVNNEYHSVVNFALAGKKTSHFIMTTLVNQTRAVQSTPVMMKAFGSS